MAMSTGAIVEQFDVLVDLGIAIGCRVGSGHALCIPCCAGSSTGAAVAKIGPEGAEDSSGHGFDQPASGVDESQRQRQVT